MVSQDEYLFAQKWFQDKYLFFKRPLGSIVNLDNNTQYSDQDLISINQRVNVYIYEMFGTYENEFTNEQKRISLKKFDSNIEDLMSEFEKDHAIEFKSKSRTGGQPLLRIAPFFGLEPDSLEIYFDLVENDCIDNPFDDNDNMDEELKIRRGCNIVIFHYDLKKDFRDKIKSLPYENKNERVIVVDGTKISEILDIDVDFMKELVNISFVSNDSKFLLKIRQYPDTILMMGNLLKKWLFKITSPTKLQRIKKM